VEKISLAVNNYFASLETEAAPGGEGEVITEEIAAEVAAENVSAELPVAKKA